MMVVWMSSQAGRWQPAAQHRALRLQTKEQGHCAAAAHPRPLPCLGSFLQAPAGARYLLRLPQLLRILLLLWLAYQSSACGDSSRQPWQQPHMPAAGDWTVPPFTHRAAPLPAAIPRSHSGGTCGGAPATRSCVAAGSVAARGRRCAQSRAGPAASAAGRAAPGAISCCMRPQRALMPHSLLAPLCRQGRHAGRSGHPGVGDAVPARRGCHAGQDLIDCFCFLGKPKLHKSGTCQLYRHWVS